MKNLKIDNEFKSLIPDLTTEELNQLEQNCIKEGIHDAIVIWNDIIIDGHNRYQIAKNNELDYKTRVAIFENRNEVKKWIILNQFGRRNLSLYDRSVLALKLEGYYKEKAKENLKLAAEKTNTPLPKSAKAINPIDTRKELSKIANVSHDTIDKVRKIEAKATTEVISKLSKGEVSINQVYQEIKQEEKKEKKQEERRKLAEEGAEKKIEIDFRLGDFEEVFADIPDGSIDCIITDPPYPYEFIECWTKLSNFAKRVLKHNGFCIAYSGQMYLPEVMERMSEHLDYYWTFAVYHEGQTQIVNGINLMCRWKPVLIFQNGKKKIDHTFQDYFISEQREKTGHDWQQSKSGVAYLIEMFTKPNDLILEPFAGSGTTILVAKEKKRRIMASEIDEQTYNIAKSIL